MTNDATFEGQTYSVAVDRAKIAGALAEVDQHAKRNNLAPDSALHWVITTLKG